MSPKMFESMQTETSGKFGGLGIEVGMEAGVKEGNFDTFEFKKRNN